MGGKKKRKKELFFQLHPNCLSDKEGGQGCGRQGGGHPAENPAVQTPSEGGEPHAGPCSAQSCLPGSFHGCGTLQNLMQEEVEHLHFLSFLTERHENLFKSPNSQKGIKEERI